MKAEIRDGGNVVIITLSTGQQFRLGEWTKNIAPGLTISCDDRLVIRPEGSNSVRLDVEP